MSLITCLNAYCMSTSEMKIDYIILPVAQACPPEKPTSKDTRLTECKETWGTYISVGCSLSTSLPLAPEEPFWGRKHLICLQSHYVMRTESKSYTFSFGFIMKILVLRTTTSLKRIKARFSGLGSLKPSY